MVDVSARDRAKTALRHYLYQAGNPSEGLKPHPDVNAEIDGIVDDIILAVIEQLEAPEDGLKYYIMNDEGTYRLLSTEVEVPSGVMCLKSDDRIVTLANSGGDPEVIDLLIRERLGK